MSNTAEKTGQKFFYGYVIVALGFLINTVLMGTLYTYSVFFEPLTEEFGWTRAATSGAFSLYMFLHGFLYIVTGKLNDKLGPRIIMSCCGLFIGAGYILMSLTSQIWHIYIFYGVIIAVGMSGGYVPLTSTVTRWFANHPKRGLMVGISVAGVGMGTMVFPPLATWLITSFGWQTSYVVIGISSLVIIMSSAQFLKRAPAEMYQSTDSNGLVIPQRGVSMQKAFKMRQFWLLSAAYFGFGFLLQSIMVHLVMHTTDLGIPRSTASSLFIMIGGASILARVLLGGAADRIGNAKIMVGSFILMVAAFVWIFFSKEMWAFYLFAIAFGAGYGGLVSSQSPIVADLFGMKSHGVILGVIVSLITFGSAVGPLIAGRIFDTTGSYTIAFIICLVFAVLGIILSMMLKPAENGGKE
ncbi:MAG: MFS transporter [Dehalococcoidales bacterium]|nr:MFS transporter [Dehalococcoidales bacterium]